MKGRNVPLADITADDRRIQACLKACANISTEALEAGLVHDVFEAEGMLVTGLALAAEIAAQGKNPAQYVDFARMVKQFTALNGRVERSGYNEAQNRAWERRNGRPLEADKGVVLAPLGKRVRHA
jgi:hypothetical protein